MASPWVSAACLAVFATVLPLPGAMHIAWSFGGNDKGTCAVLVNQGAYFGVEVGVGDPKQKFMLVADTGSNNLIVVSCTCTDTGGCAGAEHCYRGSNRSSTFKIAEDPPAVAVTFGSGTVQTVIVSEVASVGDITASMSDDLMLLTSDEYLNINGPFEGILGLGIPGADELAAGGAGDGLDAKYPKSFLEDAGVTSFSMCFSDVSDGALRMNHKLEDSMKSMGKLHWGVGLSGIIVGGDGTGGEGATLVSCSPADATAGSKSPCGMIPDSGTTLIMGPPMQVFELYATLCTEWPLCNSNYQDMVKEVDSTPDMSWADIAKELQGGYEGAEDMIDVKPLGDAAQAEVLMQMKARLFTGLLMHCQDWMEKPQDFNGVPSVHMEITDGVKTKLLEFTPWSYIYEATVPVPAEVDVTGLPKAIGSMLQQKVSKKLNPPTDVAMEGSTEGGETVTICEPAIDVMEYGTSSNGPVWIFGSPLFYQYEVGYDLDTKSMSFTRLDADGAGCEPCPSNDTKRALLTLGKQEHKRLRRLKGPPRKPYLDTTKPF